MTAADVLKLVQSGGILGLMVIIAWAGHRGIWRWKREYDDAVTRLETEIARIIKERDAETARVRADADAEAKRLQEERTRERERATKYEEYTFRLLEAANAAARVATTAVEKR